jgi:two-component system nitrate/nitrite response regulator NarL
VEPGRVLVAEDHQVLGEAILMVLSDEGYEVRLAADPRPEALLVTARGWKPAVVLLDVELRRAVPGGLAVIRQIQRLGARVIVFVDRAALTLRAACVEAGVDGLASRTDSLRDVLDQLALAVRGEPLLSERERADIVALSQREQRLRVRGHEPFGRLTRREQQVLLALMNGHSAQQIADEWFVSLATIRSQIRSVLAKLEVTTQLAAVAAAHRAGWPRARRSDARPVRAASRPAAVASRPARVAPLAAPATPLPAKAGSAS